MWHITTDPVILIGSFEITWKCHRFLDHYVDRIEHTDYNTFDSKCVIGADSNNKYLYSALSCVTQRAVTQNECNTI